MENHSQNPLQPSGSNVLLSSLTQTERVAFYKKTYAHVAGGVLVFIMFEYLLFQSDVIVDFALSMTDGYKWLIMLGGFMFITNYAEVHENFALYDLAFIAVFLSEFCIRWVAAIIRQTYMRWYFFPFIHWYDLIGCIPLGGARIFRFLRIFSISDIFFM